MYLHRLLLCIVLLTTTARAQTWRELLDASSKLEADKLYDSAMIIARTALAEESIAADNVARATVLMHIGEVYFTKQDYGQAHKYVSTATQLWRRLPDQRCDLTKGLALLGQVEFWLAQYVESHGHSRESIDLLWQCTPPDSGLLVSAYTTAAKSGFQLGKYTESYSSLGRAVDLCKSIYGERHLTTIKTINELANLQLVAGEFTLAAKNLEDLLARVDRSTQMLRWLRSSGTLVGLYHRIGQTSDAKKLGQELLAITDTIDDSLKSVRPQILINMSDVCTHSGDPKYGEIYAREAVAILDTLSGYGRTHYNYFKATGNLASALFDQQRFAEAESLLSADLPAMRQSMGERSYQILQQRGRIARALSFMGEHARAFAEADTVLKLSTRNFREAATSLNLDDALEYSQYMRWAGELLLSSIHTMPDIDPAMQRRAAEAILEIKGPVSEEIFRRRQNLLQSNDTEVRKLSRHLAEAKATAIELELTGYLKRDSAAVGRKLDSLHSTIYALETELQERLERARNSLQPMVPVFLDSVVAALPAQTCFVDYYRMYNLWFSEHAADGPMVVALYDSSGLITVRFLGNAAEIEHTVEAYRDHLQAAAKLGRLPLEREAQQYDSLSQRVSARVWQPIRDVVSKYETVLIAPDGQLHLVAFAGLKDEESVYLAERHAIHYVSSGRDLKRLAAPRGSGSGLLAVADPEFDATPQRRLAGRRDLPNEHRSTDTTMFSSIRGVANACGSIAELKFPSLPHSRREVELIVRSWPSGESTTVLQGAEASEDNVKVLAPGERVVHLATHGYYLPQKCADTETENNVTASDSNKSLLLLQSGLFLAGANLHGEDLDSSTLEDGILTAEEVMGLDLHGVDLVVLSACESGRGTVVSGEDVFGLRRAFQVAGARTVISALWPVDDEMTASMLGQLYEKSDRPVYVQLREIQMQRLQELRRLGIADHPVSWAGLVSIGGL